MHSSTCCASTTNKLCFDVCSEFDKLAKKYKVFKVETIGDCYVAVTGLPEPQENHAALLCRFAQDCNMHLTELLPSLIDKFGEDTSKLAMRTGIHVSQQSTAQLQ